MTIHLTFNNEWISAGSVIPGRVELYGTDKFIVSSDFKKYTAILQLFYIVQGVQHLFGSA